MSAEGYSEGDFEYEAEDTEAEDTEAGDESWEADEADEGDEADEAVMEADEADEADEAVPLGAMEADESDESDESDEADEADEAVVTASARLRATQDRNRREAWARKVAADRRAEMQRAASAQRAITTRIRAIPIVPRARVAGVGALQGAGVVTAILPNGRRTRMRIIPTVAPITEVNRLRATVLANEKRQAAAIATNAKAVASLASTQAAAVQRLTAHQLRTDKELSRRLVEGDNRIDARITKELSGSSGILDKYNKRMTAILRRERWRNTMNSVALATSMPFFVAYGDRNLFTWDNAFLTGSTLFWILGDDVISAFAPKKGFMQSLASIWSYSAPVLNGGGMYLYFRNKQNKRFVAGVAAVPAAATIDVPLGSYLKKGGIKALTSDTHAVAASVIGSATGITVAAALKTTPGSSSSEGSVTLTIKVDPAPAANATTNVAWIVDTQAIEPAKAS